MLVLLEGGVEREHHVEGLHEGVGQALVDGDVHDVAGNLAVVAQREVDLFAWGGDVGQKLLDLGRPLLHEGVDVGHGLGVAD